MIRTPRPSFDTALRWMRGIVVAMAVTLAIAIPLYGLALSALPTP